MNDEGGPWSRSFEHEVVEVRGRLDVGHERQDALLGHDPRYNHPRADHEGDHGMSGDGLSARRFCHCRSSRKWSQLATLA